MERHSVFHGAELVLRNSMPRKKGCGDSKHGGRWSGQGACLAGVSRDQRFNLAISRHELPPSILTSTAVGLIYDRVE